MRLASLCTLLALLAAPAAFAQAPTGSWLGALDVPGLPEPLRLTIRVVQAGDSLTSTIDIPQQGAVGIPATTTDFRTDSLVVTYALFGGRLDLGVAADSLRGTFSQGPNTLPITFGPTTELVRPQTPRPPFPYATEDVTVDAAPGVTLAGTFVRPAGAGPFPAVLLLSGSGAQDRDESLFGHRPFAVLADHLARNGIASLRLDDRGTDESTGDYGTTTIADLTSDADAALVALRAMPGVAKVGIIGHSLGGIVAPRVAGADFLVLLAAPAVKGSELYVLQIERLTHAGAAGTPAVDSTTAATAATAFAGAVRAAMQPLLEDPTAPDSTLQAPMEAAFNAALVDVPTSARQVVGLAGPAYVQVRRQVVAGMLSTELRGILLSDPTAALAAIRVPTLALYGSLDAQVAADQNAPAMRAADPRAEVVVLAGKNHLFQSATTGAGAEYGQIEETMAPEALGAVTAFVLRVAR